MNRSRSSRWGAVGAVLAGLAVAAGAFGAHGLQNRIDDQSLVIWETASRYQMYHGLALLVTSTRLQQRTSARMTWARWLFLSGVVLFSGSLYALALTGITGLGVVTPIGGLAFLAGWFLLAVAILETRAPDGPPH